MFSAFFAAVTSMVPLETMAPIISEHAQPKYSNNEKHFAYLAPDARGAYNLHVDGKCLTHARRAISQFFWEPDDEHLLYLYDEEGSENAHLFRVNLDGVSEDLTPYSDVHVEFVTMSESKPNQALIRMNLRDSRYLDCYQIDLVSKEVCPASEFVDCRNNVFADDDLLPIVCINYQPNGQKFLEVYEDREWHPIWTLDPDDWYPTVMRLSNGGQKVVLLTATGLSARGVVAIDKKTGACELLFSHPKLDCIGCYFDGFQGLTSSSLQYLLY
ncbi:MAG: hypothetical protein KDK64_00980 [Chlamydiia bacterium]|nr:hypothetical protein [Chlamydiia bacterium]